MRDDDTFPNTLPRRTIRLCDDGGRTLAATEASGRSFVEIIDQTKLPHRLEFARLRTVADAATAISTMQVRGAPLIGATSAWGLWLAARDDASDAALRSASDQLVATRPTAVNLRWAVDRVLAIVLPLPTSERAHAAALEAERICDEDVAVCRAIGEHGLGLIRAAWDRTDRSRPVRILTHCNAGWLATVEWGTALAPIHLAQEAGIPVHVWVDETRPRNQGASLTAWELGHSGVPHTVIADNAGGHLMQRGQVDLCIVGTDRTTADGDVCNKIGTYLKALAAHDNGVPFYVAAPSSSIDFALHDGLADIPIEERSESEVTHLAGVDDSGTVREIRVVPEGSRAANPAFDVTPARLVTALVTERGVCEATEAGLRSLFADRFTDAHATVPAATDRSAS